MDRLPQEIEMRLSRKTGLSLAHAEDVVMRAASTEWVIPPLEAMEGETHTSLLTDQRWREAFAAQKFAEALAWLCRGVALKSLDPLTRVGFRKYADELVEDAIQDLGGVEIHHASQFEAQEVNLGHRDDVDFDGLTEIEKRERGL